MVEARVRAPVQPTESAAKVRDAVLRLFPAAVLAESDWGLEGPAGDLAHLGRLVREQRIPDTARAVMLRGQEGASTRFVASKQAAAAGRLNFAAREGPLGDIHVEVHAASAGELLRLIDEVAPDTRGWSLEARGLTERSLREQDSEEGVLDDLDRAYGDGGPDDDGAEEGRP